MTKAAGTLLFYRSTGSFPVEGDPLRRSQRTGFPVADEYKLMPTSPFYRDRLGGICFRIAYHTCTEMAPGPFVHCCFRDMWANKTCPARRGGLGP